ncbi:MAG: thiamine-phosphate kinase [Alistipes sp.]|nr:thiamine-phosphate kinase [Alistipes sp.]
MAERKRTEIAELGQFGLIERLTRDFTPRNATTVSGPGDDAALIAAPDDERLTVLSTDMMLEGVDFDLTYFPLKHLGYKVVTRGISDILAMNALPEQITVALGISSKLPVEALEDFYEGVRFACLESGVDLAGGDTTASVTGLAIAVTATGSVLREAVARRSGARLNDLICITGNLGAAYMGLHLLERERRVLGDVENPEPQFKGYEYLLEKYLKPRPRRDVIESLAAEKLVPTSMIDISDGLSSDLLQICRSSKCGARIYLERIPIARQTTALAEELHSDPVVAALHGGEDHELLFTVPVTMRERIEAIGGIDIIGHITAPETGAMLVTPDGGEIELRAQGFVKKRA